MPVANVTFADANLAACVADATAMMVNPGTFDVTRRRQIKQVLLAFPVDDPFSPASVDPTLVPGKLF